ncbi:MAG: hypothetical protein CMC81_02685 [Flavobacteriaceae bacterium]|nr:hypothetical protein [Flavobacteriaceae bacterium]|tara:strand:- start:3001 stop:3249 length:249 start_codon:yes stop_codon:yes gene_type:complete
MYLSLKRIWHREQVRVVYAYSVASLNFVAAIFFISASLFGDFNIFNAIAFGFLHSTVGIVLITTMKVNKKFNDEDITLKVKS